MPVPTASPATGELSDLVRVEDPDFYNVDNAALLARLRNEAPVYFAQDLNTWVFTKYADVKEASRTPDVYSVRKGILLNDVRYGESIADTFFADGAELVSTLDPPRHTEVRRTLAPAFTPRAIARLEDAIRTVCCSLLDGFEAGRPLEFVHEFGRVLPIQTVAQLLGVPADEVDVDKIEFWTDEMLKMGAPLSREELEVAAANTADMGAFLLGLFERKRAEPGGLDLMSTLAAAELDNDALSQPNILALSIATLVAGNETTRNMLSGIVWSLVQHPDQMALLAADPDRLIKPTVEEVLRWITPVPGFIRNATQDVEVRGQTIRKGDYVYLLYFAANRDEECWTDADTFDITRPTDPAPLSFGFGQHACIGAAVARLEARIFLEEMLRRFSGIESAGEATRVPSPLQHGWSSLPVTFTGRGV